MQPPASTARLIGELSVVLIAIAVLCIPSRPHAATRAAAGCEPQTLLAVEEIAVVAQSVRQAH